TLLTAMLRRVFDEPREQRGADAPHQRDAGRREGLGSPRHHGGDVSGSRHERLLLFVRLATGRHERDRQARDGEEKKQQTEYSCPFHREPPFRARAAQSECSNALVAERTAMLNLQTLAAFLGPRGHNARSRTCAASPTFVGTAASTAACAAQKGR